MSISWTGHRPYRVLGSRFDLEHKRWTNLLCPAEKSELAFSMHRDTSFRICINPNKDNP